MRETTESGTLLEVRGLRTHFFADEGVVKAVDGADFSIPDAKTVCIVGESGCGKSITARSVLQLIDPPGRIIEGEILFRRRSRGNGVGEQVIDLASLDPRSEEMRDIRGREISMVFQEPMASFSPMYTIGDQLTEAITLHIDMPEKEARERAIAGLRRVGIPQPEQRMHAYPWQLSGGMCQRAMIAVALSCGPSLLIADEPTTALDVTTQARILDLIVELQQETRMAVMFITHDLGVVAEIADEVAVMYLGHVVERGSVDEIFHDPKHPYTKALLRSIPTMGLGVRHRLDSIQGMVPHPYARPPGCPFHNRCDEYMPGACDHIEPPVIPLGRPDRSTRCLLYGGAETTQAAANVAEEA
jgi:peptide/nickel transport system ATP-binding protein